MPIAKKNSRKTIIGILAIVIAVLMTTGCVSVLHEIYQDSKGRIQTRIRITINRQLMESLNEMGDSPKDSDDLFDLGDDPLDLGSDQGLENITAVNINNEIETGVQIQATVKKIRKGTDPFDMPFVPIKQGNSILIAIPPMDEEDQSSDDDSGMAGLFFASSKYQLLLDKKLYPELTSAEIISGGDTMPVALTEINANWLVEFPVSVWFDSSEGFIIKLNK